ncbi:MAG: EAL domain-containing protein [Gammaproteobacteria bacterium]
MKRNSESHHILALYDAADEIEQIMNDLRNKGLATRSTVVNDLESLNRELREQQYDLILSQAEIDAIEITDVLDQVKRMDKDIPIICLAEYHDPDQISTLLSQGIAQVLAMDEPQYIGYVIQRELKHLKERRAKRRSELHVQEVEKRCFLLLESSRDAIAYIADGMHILANSAYVELFGFQNTEEIAGLPLLDMIHEDSHETLIHAIRTLQNQGAGHQECPLTCVNTSGSTIQVSSDISAATFEGETCIQLILQQQVNSSNDRALQEKLKQMTQQCLVTGLANRQHYEEMVCDAIERAVKQNISYTIFYIHLDGFHKKRAKIGVDGIDQAAKDTAALMRQHFPEDAVLARFGEDTYAVLWEQNDIDSAERLAQDFAQSVKAHLFEGPETTITLTTSIGIAALNEGAESPREIISRAFAACRTAQNTGGDTVSVFVKEQKKTTIIDQTASAQELQKAIDNNLFKILFQPIISLRGSDTEFYEVLLRRVNENGALESPEAFLATAESAKVATIVDRWVILQSVRALISKRMEGNNTKILINLTKQSLDDKTFLPWLSVALKATRLPANSVVFQIAAQEAEMQIKHTQELANELKKLNCQVSLSRFGDHEEIDALLQHIKPWYIKCDAQFTKGLSTPAGKTQLTQLLECVHKHEVSSVIPFVENAPVLAHLWQMGVHYVQGFYLQPPMETMDYDFSQDEDEV